MSSIAPPAKAKGRTPPFIALATTRPRPGQSVPSPCVNVCRIASDSGLCAGCWRTADEIGAWRASDDAFKLAVWERVEQRQEQAGVPR
ncbi:MAG: hypothetical protein RJA36_2302 [Pseudomonadota bacterium]|jgi:predicted Fe-S protein YdhL (DUF1289 family)